DNGVISGRDMLATILVDQAVKGQTSRSISVKFFVPNVAAGFAQIVPDDGYRMFFLKGTSEPFDLASRYYASIVSAPGISLTAQRSLDRAHEAVGAIAVDATIPLPARREALYALLRSKNEFAIKALRQAVNDDQDEVRLNALVGLLQAGDVSVLPRAIDAL